MIGVKYIQAINTSVMPCAMSRRNTPSEATNQAAPSVKISCGMINAGSHKMVGCNSWRTMTVATTNASIPNIWLPNEEITCATGNVSNGKTTRFTRLACVTIVVDDCCSVS